MIKSVKCAEYKKKLEATKIDHLRSGTRRK